MSVVVSIDAGTTGVRALAVGEAGDVVAWRYQEFPQHFPRPGWVEHDPHEIWTAVQAVLAALMDDVAQPISCIGMTDQRETVVAWSRSSGQALHNAIVWQDRRTAERCDALREAGHLPLIRESTGLVLDPYFSASKMEWLLNEGGVTADADLALGTIDSWLLWQLSGGAVHATEPSNASRTMLLDIRTGEWSRELCELFGVPQSALGDVMPSAGSFGVTAADVVPGVPAGVPVSGIAGDQQAALFGQACIQPGMVKNTYGTGSFVLMNVGTTCPAPVEGLLTTIAWQLERGGPLTYAYEGAIFVTGAAIQWLRDGLGIIDEAPEIGPLAASVPDNGGVVVVPAFTGLGSPWWDPYARGTILGLTRGSGRAHLARAVVESIAFQTRDVVDAMSNASGHAITALRADGGASAMDLLLQMQADLLRVPVARPVVQETTALGAAYLAGLATGVWSSVDELAAKWQLDVELRPESPPEAMAGAYEMWKRAVHRARAL